ncbi:hypothetical protein QFC24_004589 [Naganishia onofrii]|uniref:Uncharacterized protein n=1 Tax=Naganishia onofrii TaxID=1851511 RepID=A0ACC2XG50_9TREE|nr:hypothetical protein QFC24_004589 [Naganishia onofrii]
MPMGTPPGSEETSPTSLRKSVSWSHTLLSSGSWPFLFGKPDIEEERGSDDGFAAAKPTRSRRPSSFASMFSLGTIPAGEKVNSYHATSTETIHFPEKPDISMTQARCTLTGNSGSLVSRDSQKCPTHDSGRNSFSAGSAKQSKSSTKPRIRLSTGPDATWMKVRVLLEADIDYDNEQASVYAVIRYDKPNNLAPDNSAASMTANAVKVAELKKLVDESNADFRADCKEILESLTVRFVHDGDVYLPSMIAVGDEKKDLAERMDKLTRSLNWNAGRSEPAAQAMVDTERSSVKIQGRAKKRLEVAESVKFHEKDEKRRNKEYQAYLRVLDQAEKDRLASLLA